MKNLCSPIIRNQGKSPGFGISWQLETDELAQLSEPALVPNSVHVLGGVKRQATIDRQYKLWEAISRASLTLTAALTVSAGAADRPSLPG